MRTTKHRPTMNSFTVLYKLQHRYDTDRSADPTVYTYVCNAIDREDAIRQLKVSRYTRVGSKRFCRRFKVVDVYTVKHGEGVCECKWCATHPPPSRKVRVIKSRMPYWVRRLHTA